MALLGCLLAVVTCTPVAPWWAARLAGPWDAPTGDTLIVLAGSALEDGILGESSYLRSVYAVRAWRAGGFRHIVITGGSFNGEPAAVAMRRFLVSEGVPLQVIQLETASLSTRENAVNVARLLAGNTTRKVLMTSDYHMFRSRRAFARAGLRVLPRPLPDVVKRGRLWQQRWALFIRLCTETGKIAYYRMRGWI